MYLGSWLPLSGREDFGIRIGAPRQCKSRHTVSVVQRKYITLSNSNVPDLGWSTGVQQVFIYIIGKEGDKEGEREAGHAQKEK